MIAKWWRKLRGTAIVASQLRSGRRVPFLPHPQIEAIRDARIRRAVMHAARSVPYYRDLFRRLALDPRSIRGGADLDRLPLLDRSLVRADPVQFVSESIRPRDSVLFLTSGSTGTRVEVRHDRQSLLSNIAFGERERQVLVRVAGGKRRPTEVHVTSDTGTLHKVTAYYAANLFLPVRARRRFVSVHATIEDVASILDAERPDLLVGYGGWIDLFFRTIAAKGIDVHRPTAVVYIAEGLPPGGREFIEGTFGIPVLSRYNAMESFKIGFLCEWRTGFHLHEDLCHVRIVDQAGRTLPPGECGEIVLSNLVNRATVLLNYRIGDAGALAAAPCPCGRTLRMLSTLEGRIEDMLRLTDGRIIHPRMVWAAFREEPEVLQYQLIQLEQRDRFLVTLVTSGSMGAFQRAVDRARPRLHDLLGVSASFEFAERKEFLAGSGGKFRSVLSRAKH
jgi:phenylacetate-CoA ligase